MNALYPMAACLTLVSVLGLSVPANAADEPADTIYAGDDVTVVEDNVELGLRDKPATTLNTGDTVRVTEVRGSWIGGYAMKNGQRFTGWVHRDEVKLVVIPEEKAPPIEVPDMPDDPKAVAALRELQVKLDLNDKGNVHSADGTESKIEDALFGPSGTLWSVAVQDYPPPPPARFDKPYRPYAMGVVDLDDGLRVLGQLTAEDPGTVKVGQRVELVIDTLCHDEEGNEITTWKFKS